MRRCCVSAILQIYSVSIHAPWEGCDRSICPLSMRNEAFQFTHPGKGATDILRFLSSPGLCFNSRTLGRVRPTGPYLRKRFSEFQFTHPGKGATESALHQAQDTAFQFTHPGKGATEGDERHREALRVSIHAPWEGCDRRLTFRSVSIGAFQFTHPGKGATTGAGDFPPIELFQFTHPGKGATPRRRGATRKYRVSIHAPWEGCDDSHFMGIVACFTFQFTHPGKGATRAMLSVVDTTTVSIHAPWEGCDYTTIFIAARITFQFTHPGKGATTPRHATR